MKCAQARPLLSPYLDGAVSGSEMRGLGVHLQECPACKQEFDRLRQVQQLLVRAGRRRAPADLALKLRVAISQEAARSRRPVWDGIVVRVENALNAFMVPAMAGLATAVVV